MDMGMVEVVMVVLGGDGHGGGRPTAQWPGGHGGDGHGGGGHAGRVGADHHAMLVVATGIG